MRRLRRKRAGQLRRGGNNVIIKTKRTICRAVGFLALLLALGFVGGMERELIAVGKGAALALGCEIVGTAALWKGGVIRVE